MWIAPAIVTLLLLLVTAALLNGGGTGDVVLDSWRETAAIAAATLTTGSLALTAAAIAWVGVERQLRATRLTAELAASASRLRDMKAEQHVARAVANDVSMLGFNLKRCIEDFREGHIATPEQLFRDLDRIFSRHDRVQPDNSLRLLPSEASFEQAALNEMNEYIFYIGEVLSAANTPQKHVERLNERTDFIQRQAENLMEAAKTCNARMRSRISIEEAQFQVLRTALANLTR